MAKNNDPKKIITGWDTRWSYCNVWEPKGIDGSKPAWSVSLIIPKSDKETLSKIEKAIQAAYEEGASILKGTGKTVPPLSAINSPLNDGDEKRSGDPAYENAYYLNAKNYQRAPGIVDKDRQDILDHSEVYSGVYGRACILLCLRAFHRMWKNGEHHKLVRVVPGSASAGDNPSLFCCYSRSAQEHHRSRDYILLR